MRHRHLDVAPDTRAGDLPLAALDDVLDRGTIEDWRPLLRAIRSDPHGALAGRVLHLCARHEMFGTSRLLPVWIGTLRAHSGAASKGPE